MFVLVLTCLGFTGGVVAIAALFVRRQRVALVRALQDSNKQQVAVAQQLAGAIDHIQRQQRQYEQQLQDMAQAAARLGHEVVALGKRVERDQSQTAYGSGDRVLH